MISGREAELQVLRQLVRDACAGAGGTVLVVGEPGVGKTALLEEIGAESPELADVGRIRAVEAESALPYAALTSLLHRRRAGG